MPQKIYKSAVAAKLQRKGDKRSRQSPMGHPSNRTSAANRKGDRVENGSIGGVEEWQKFKAHLQSVWTRC
jgi:hypothetical protein